MEHHSRRRSLGHGRGAGARPSAHVLTPERARRRPPEAPRPEFVPVLVTVPRGRVDAYPLAALRLRRITAGLVVAALLAGTLTAACAILPHG